MIHIKHSTQTEFRMSEAGREWQPSGEPEEVSTYDFPSLRPPELN